MSSHHIVRDQQEPALMIQDLQHFPLHQLYALLEWSPSVMVSENVINRFTMLGHKLDFALISLDRQEYWEDYLADQQPVEFVSDTGDWLRDGLDFYLNAAHRAVNVIVNPDSVQVLLPSLYDWYDIIGITYYTPTERYFIPSGNHFSKWVQPGYEVSVILNQAITNIHWTGLVEANEGSEGTMLLKAQEEGVVSIRSEKTFILCEAIEHFSPQG